MKHAQRAFASCAQVVERCGKVFTTGTLLIDGRDLARREISVLGSFAYVNDAFARAVQSVGLVDERWVNAVPLDDVGERIFHRLMESPDAYRPYGARPFFVTRVAAGTDDRSA